MRAIQGRGTARWGPAARRCSKPYSDEPATSGLLTTPPEEVYARRGRVEGGGKTGINASATAAQPDRDGRIRAACSARSLAPAPCAAHRARADSRCVGDPSLRAPGHHARCSRRTRRRTCRGWPTHGPARTRRAHISGKRCVSPNVVLARALTSGRGGDPMLGLYAAITRQDQAGRPRGG